MASNGSTASANRIGNAPSTTGISSSAEYGPVRPVWSPSSTISGPSDSAAISKPATTQAITRGRRISQAAQSTATISSDGPRKVLYSAGPVLSRAEALLPATESGEIAGQLARSAEK
ncbi:hypothetical protein [Micromonospora zhanjiangensis]